MGSKQYMDLIIIHKFGVSSPFKGGDPSPLGPPAVWCLWWVPVPRGVSSHTLCTGSTCTEPCCEHSVPRLPLRKLFVPGGQRWSLLLLAFPIQVLVNIYWNDLNTHKSIWQDHYWSTGKNPGSLCTHKFAGYAVHGWEWWKPAVIFETTNKNYCNRNYSTENKTPMGSVYGWVRGNNVCNIIQKMPPKGCCILVYNARMHAISSFL